ncbi:MAG: methylmalonyl-CoA mutase family protein, partial [Flavobacteriales bacterium]|nr:methylmalonyl-CoA mutase family protein [Flavobacteriales bacterium]
MEQADRYIPKHKVRIVTAASLFDGHDAAINIMRRIIQATGCEVIHLGHDRSVEEVVNCAIEEDANAIAMTSYQGGHNEYLKYMYDLLQEKNATHIKVFAGGGGTILPEEITELEAYGITRIYHPDDGREMGLQGMINDLIERSDFLVGEYLAGEILAVKEKNVNAIARLISVAENCPEKHTPILSEIKEIATQSDIPVLGITGTGGAGKSSLVDELVRRFITDFPSKDIAIVSVDPSKRKTGGALLGDRIRMNAIKSDQVYMRSLATRQANLALSAHVNDALDILKVANYDLIILETSGIGQSDTEIIEHSDVSLYVMTPEYGAATQLEKIDMLDFADLISINKFDKKGGLDAIRDVKKQYQRNNTLFDKDVNSMPVYGTIASQFNDLGVNSLYKAIMDKFSEKGLVNFNSSFEITDEMSEKIFVIPPNRVRYLSEISENNRAYDKWAIDQREIAQKLYALQKSLEILANASKDIISQIKGEYKTLLLDLHPKNKILIDTWEKVQKKYQEKIFKFKVRDRELSIETDSTSLSGSSISKISLPKYEAWGDLLKWQLQENVPGEFPFTAGLFPFKREGEDPTRMFAGEGGPERTNKRFHLVSLGMPAKRLSTAFDSVTLYGNDPGERPDIYGKIGNAGVS